MSATVAQREAAYLEHLQGAKALGISLSEYCRRNDLRVEEWYQVRRQMVQKGLMTRTQGGGRRNRSRPPVTAFAPVRLTAAPPAAAATPCLIRHPSGWMIECTSLPAASWLNALVVGVHR
jgi:hypothetical protein